MRGLRPGLQILDRRPLTPLRHSLRVDPQLSAQRRERSLRSLYCCSDGVRGRGAPMTNLSHMASFHSNERISPSNRGIKHLGGVVVVDRRGMTDWVVSPREVNPIIARVVIRIFDTDAAGHHSMEVYVRRSPDFLGIVHDATLSPRVPGLPCRVCRSLADATLPLADRPHAGGQADPI